MWVQKTTCAVGGLREVGFTKDSKYLMVLSGQGRGIFDALSGEKLIRDHSDYYMDEWDDETAIVRGFEFLDGVEVICGGFEAPNPLRQTTKDGWQIVIEKEKRLDWKQDNVDSTVLYLVNNQQEQSIEIDYSPYGYDRAIGFSDSGGTFVLATSSEVNIWVKE